MTVLQEGALAAPQAEAAARPRSPDRGYKKILVGVDNSRHSDRAVLAAARLARALDASLVGFHVYAARLHEDRFLQMEPTLPERYPREEVLRRRSVHEILISKGLRVISESYIEHARDVCQAAGLPFEGRLAEGQNYAEILSEARTGAYDLVVLGARGLGSRRRTVVGSVCERVIRAAPSDVLVERDAGDGSSGILVAVDGSRHSYQALARALTMGAALGQPVEVVSVYDPQFHVVAFRRLAKVLSAEAAAVFRFGDQEKLHTEIIDQGLNRLYRSYLGRATEMAARRGQAIETTLLTGKAFQCILDHVARRRPWLVVAARFGQHAAPCIDIGSTTENLVRLAPCSVLIVAGADEGPAGRPQAEPERTLPWTAEAIERLGLVPPFARDVVQRAVEAHARRQGHHNVTPEVMVLARETMGW